jgi:hypothetical protein
MMNIESTTVTSTQTEIEKHRDRIRCSPHPRTMKYLNLIKKAVPPPENRQFPSEEQTRATLGVELDTTLNYLTKFERKKYSRQNMLDLMRNDFDDVDAFSKMVDEYIEDEKKCCEITEISISLLKDWIKKNQKHVPHELLVDLEKDMCAANDNKWIEQDHVWEIWSDGEIVTTKGRYLYGARSMFSFHPSLLHKFDMKLPRSQNGLTYCIVESEAVAIEFRNRMISIADTYKP